MGWKLRKTQNKVEHLNKSLYISGDLVQQIDKIATENNTSFNNVVVSMVESCLKQSKERS
jgi:hypothetical protein